VLAIVLTPPSSMSVSSTPAFVECASSVGTGLQTILEASTCRPLDVAYTFDCYVQKGLSSLRISMRFGTYCIHTGQAALAPLAVQPMFIVTVGTQEAARRQQD
jgi:hypothetical protein